MLLVHHHSDTGSAYDSSNCEDDHAHAVLIIDSEGVVGLAWAWPIAVTVETGALHSPLRDTDRAGLVSLMAEAGYSEADVQVAIDAAKERGFPIDPVFLLLDGRAS